MGCLCPTPPAPPARNIAQVQQTTAHLKPAPLVAHPDSERRHIAFEGKQERKNTHRKKMDRKQSTFSSGVKNDKNSESSNLSGGRNEQESQVKNSMWGKNFSRSTTIITKCSKLERTVSYVSESQGINSMLSTPCTNDRKQQMYILEKGSNPNGADKFSSMFYSLIKNKAYVKKPNRPVLKVTSPSGTLQLLCQPQLVRETIFLAEGIPLENIKLLECSTVDSPTNFVVEPKFELNVQLCLKCLECKRPANYEFSVSFIKLNFTCECSSDKFEITRFGSTKEIPLWIDGVRLTESTKTYQKDGQIRAMGCTSCWNFVDCTTLGCGCWKCKRCREQADLDKCVFCDP